MRGINQLCVDRRHDKVKIDWPKDHILYRGAGLPDNYKTQFKPGLKYRVPMYLATSTNRSVSTRIFCRRAHVDCGQPPVLYVLYLNAEHGCLHVNYVDKTNVPDESEFLFVPYSTFTVKRVDWKQNPTWESPHEVHLICSIDNHLEPDDLPLISWH